MGVMSPEAIAVGNGGLMAVPERKTATDVATSTASVRGPRFRRNFFVSQNPEKRLPTEGTKKGETEQTKNSEWVEFKPRTREIYTKILDDFVTKEYHAWNAPGGREPGNFQPHEEAMLQILLDPRKADGTPARLELDGTEASHTTLKRRIEGLLATPEGWILSKQIIDQQLVEESGAIGLMSTLETTDKRTNPQDLIKELFKGDKKRMETFKQLVRHPTILNGALGGGAGYVVGAAGEKVFADPDVQHAIVTGLQTIGTTLSHLHTPAELAGYGGAVIGGFLGARFRRGEHGGKAEAGGIDSFAVSKQALDAIKSDPSYAQRVKAKLGIDVSDYLIDDDSKSITLVDNPKSTANIESILGHALELIEARDMYFDDLQIPPGDRDIMPEQFLLRGGDPEITGERIQQKIMESYRKLQDKGPDQWGQTPDNPYYRKRGPDEKPDIGNFITDPQGRGPDDPLFFRGDAKDLPALGDYDSERISIRGNLRENSILHPLKRIREGAEVVEKAPDKWGQPEKFHDGTPNPFYGKVNADIILGANAMDLLSSRLTTTEIQSILTFTSRNPDVVDKWGQKPDDPGFGRERMAKRFTGKEKLEPYDEEKVKVRPRSLDKLGQQEGTLYWGTGIDGDSVPLPEVNPLALVNGDGEPDIWDQRKFLADGTTPNPYYGRMDGRLARREAQLSDVNVNALALKVIEGAKDQWGQLPSLPDGTPNPAYGRWDQGADPRTIPDVDVSEPLNDDGTDRYGQKALYPNGEMNPFFRRMNGELFPAFYTGNFDLTNLTDIWGQRSMYPDNTPNEFFGKVDGRRIKFDIKNFEESNLVDKFGQSYYRADGSTPNPFFGREDEHDLADFKLENIDDKYLVDKWRNRPRNPDGSRNIFFGKARRPIITEEFDLQNFDITNLVDDQGRDFRDPLFGRGEYDGKIPDIDVSADRTMDARGNSLLDPAFWTDAPIPPGGLKPDYSLFNPATGTDNRDRLPTHPLFCIDVDEKTPDKFKVDNFTRDKWGQPEKFHDGTPNPVFGIRNESEIEGITTTENLVLLRKARELVMADLTESLIVRMKLTPERSVSVLDEKIREREEGGRILIERQKQVTKDIGQLLELQSSFDERSQSLNEYRTAEGQLNAAKNELDTFLRTRFGPTHPELNNPRELMMQIGDFVKGYGELQLRVGGKATIYDSREARFSRAEREHQQKLTAINALQSQPVAGPGGLTQRLETAEELMEKKQNLVLEEQARYEQTRQDITLKFDDQATRVSEMQAELERHLIDISEQQENTASDGDLARERHKILYLRGDFLEEAWKLTDKDEVRALLLTHTPEEIVKKINELHDADTNIPPFGWGADENEGVDKNEILLYAITAQKATENDSGSVMDFRNNVNLQTILDERVSYEQLEDLSELDLQTYLAGRGVTLDEAEIREAKNIVRKYAENMTEATQLLKESYTSHIQRLQQSASSDELSESEKVQIELAKDVMKRQDAIFGSTAEFMADLGKNIPLVAEKGGVPAHSKNFSELKDSEKDHYSDSEKKLGEEKNPPLGYYEIMDVLFDYKHKTDRDAYFKKISEKVTPDILLEIMKNASENSQLPLEIGGANLEKFLYNLQQHIRSGFVTRRSLRQMFVGVVDSLEARAMVMD